MKRLRRQAGFTLIELMVTMVVAGFIWVGVFDLFKAQMQASLSNQDDTEAQSAVQAVAEIIRSDVVLAGFGSADAGEPIIHYNNYYTTGDMIDFNTTAQFGSAINTMVVAGPLGTTGNKVWVRCFGEHGWGGAATANKDAATFNPFNGTYLYINFYSPFDGKRLTSTPLWTYISASNPTVGKPCIPNPFNVDANSDGVADPAIELTTGYTLNVPNGTVVYGLRWSGGLSVWGSRYFVDTATQTLVKTSPYFGAPQTQLLTGVENMQVEYHVKGQPATTWLDSLSGVNTQQIDNIRVALVVRNLRKDPHGAVDPRTSIRVYDQNYNIPDRSYPRQNYEFYIRPINNNYTGD